MSIELVVLSFHLNLCHPLLFSSSIFSSSRVFSNETALHMRWPKYWSFSFSISPSNEFQGCFPLGLTGLISMQSKGLSRAFSNITEYCAIKYHLIWSQHQRIDVFELWYWRRLLRIPWTAWRSNQSILKEINSEYSLEGLMLKLKLQYLAI